MNKETIKLLLEAFGYVLTPHGGTRAHVWDSDEARFVVQAYKVLEEALAKQEQGEPVAWMMHNSSGDEISITESNLRHHQPAFVQDLWKDATPLYTTPQPNQELVCVCGAVWQGDELVHPPQQRKPLTDERAIKVVQDVVSTSDRPIGAVALGLLVLRAIEAAHGIIQNYPEKDKT